MSEQEQTTPATEPNEQPQEGQSAETQAETEKAPEEGESSGSALSREDMAKELEKVRQEAAGYRVRLRQTEEKFAGAKTPEEFEAALTEVRNQNAALERQILLDKVARKHELPEALAKRLTGATEEELEADAAELAKLITKSAAPETLTGGLDPTDNDDGENDPRKLARRIRR